MSVPQKIQALGEGRRRVIRLVRLAALLAACAAIPARAGEDAYYDTALPDLALAPATAHLHTHLCTVGFVASRPRREKDGDTHIRLCQGSLCVVLEAIPEAPVSLPRKGQKIKACGIQRWDSWHSWQAPPAASLGGGAVMAITARGEWYWTAQEATGAPRPILVGESNPYSGADPEFALYPEPAYSAGGRLCRLVLGLEPRQYLRRYDRRNLCGDKWRIVEAREAALAIREELEAKALKEPFGQHRGVAVLLGTKVCQAFGVDFRPFSVMAMVGAWRAVIIPHPSGLSRAWNDPGAFERARAVLREAGAL